jgi:ADP-heptose:LPS heptosyltransferase/SAM-dependent methyltransferase
MTWSRETSQGNEQDKIAAFVVPYTRGIGLDIGCALGRKCWPHMIGLDRSAGPEVDIIAEADSLGMFADMGLDFVFSSHALEDLEDTEAALREWWRVIKPGGHLVLYLPHRDFYPHMGEEGANPAHKHDFHPGDIISHMDRIGPWRLVENEVRSEGDEYSFFQVYRKAELGDWECLVDPWERNPKGKKRALVVRFGAIGDMIMMSTVLPGLKEQGYHVTVCTTPQGQDVVRHNPHIDAWWIQDKGQVPNVEGGLEAYLRTLQSRFDRVINLSESVEVALLMVRGRSNHWHDLEARRRIAGGVNYLERQCDIAGVPHDFTGARFYPTPDEVFEASHDAVELAPGPIVYWALSGTSGHKTYPWAQVVVGWLLQRTDATVVLFGGPGEADLASMVEIALSHPDAAEMLGSDAPIDFNRLLVHVGDWSIRRSLAFIEQADVIVGPETGALNAAAMLQVPKVVMLSHSGHENLTKHWHRTVVLEPVDCPCHPCHAMHYNWDDCHWVEKPGGALCAVNIRPDLVYNAIAFALGLDNRLQLASD